MRRQTVAGLTALLLSGAVYPLFSQSAPLQIVSVAPEGEVAERADARQIRIAFSEPMVAIGEAPRVPDWITIVPAIRASYYWSGSRTLIVASDDDLPFATAFTVTLAASATSLRGNRLAAPHVARFATPSVRIKHVEFRRQTGKVDSPVLLTISFNQPIDARKLSGRLVVRHRPRPWSEPRLSEEARAILEVENPAGLAAFDRKVEEGRQLALTMSSLRTRIAPRSRWTQDEREQSDKDGDILVVETLSAPPVNTRLEVVLVEAADTPDSAVGRPGKSGLVDLEPLLFAVSSCRAGFEPAQCGPGYVRLTFGSLMNRAAVLAATRVTDVTSGRPPSAISAGPLMADHHNAEEFPEFGVIPPESSWRIDVDPRLTSEDGQTLGYPFVHVRQSGSTLPVLAPPAGTWERSNGPVLPLLARNTPEVSLSVATIDPADLARELTLTGPHRDPSPPQMYRLSGQRGALEAHPLDLSQWFGADSVGLVKLVRGGARYLVQSTNLGITVRESRKHWLVFVTTLNAAAAVGDAQVRVVSPAGALLWTGVTGADGVAIAPRPVTSSTTRAIVSASVAGDTAWVQLDHSWGLDPTVPWWRGSAFTDRRLYAAGDEVRVKAIVRDESDDVLKPFPEGTEFVARVTGGDEEVDRRTVRVNRWSTAEWSVKLPAGIRHGRYGITLDRPGAKLVDYAPWLAEFEVATFRLPDFEVKAVLAPASNIQNAPLQVSARAAFLFGAALRDRPVYWRLSRTPTFELPDAVVSKYSGFIFGPGRLNRDAEQVLRSGHGNLDAAGQWNSRLTEGSTRDEPVELAFEAQVISQAGQAVAHRQAVVSHPASFYVGLERIPYFTPRGSSLRTALQTVNLDGSPKAGVRVSLELFREVWTYSRPRTAFASGWSSRRTTIRSWTVTTTSAPIDVDLSATAPGAYGLKATARDEGARPTRTETSFYVTGGASDAWGGWGTDLTLTPERPSWQPGETARILVRSPWPRAETLISKERQGIRSYERRVLDNQSNVIEVPLSQDDVPGVIVSVTLVKGRTGEQGPDDPGRPDVRTGAILVPVDPGGRRLTVKAQTARETYVPGARADVSVSVTDRTGRPRLSEVTLWAIDKGAAMLGKDTLPDLIAEMYVTPGILNRTQDNRFQLIRRHPFAGRGEPPPWAPTALEAQVFGIGDLVRSQTATVSSSFDPVRTDFRTLAFWIGSLETDDAGKATAAVTLPDGLTTYRIVATASTRTSEFGVAEASVRTTKAVTLIQALPRFLAAGDTARIGAIVTNNTGRPATATVEAVSATPDVLEVGTTAPVRLAPGESQRVLFEARARAAGVARVRMSVRLGDATDALELPLPVIARVRRAASAAYGETVAEARERVSLPAGGKPSELSVHLSSSAVTGLREGVAYLEQYPFNCAEQRASRALSWLLTAELRPLLGLGSSGATEARDAARREFDALRQHQCGHGPFSLFPDQCLPVGDTYLTAYVLDVLRRAEGFGVTHALALERTLEHLERTFDHYLENPGEFSRVSSLAEIAYVFKVLAEYRRPAPAGAPRLLSHLDRMPVFALSYLADGYASRSDRGPVYQDILRRIQNALRVSADHAFVAEREDEELSWIWSSQIRSTAIVLEGLSRRRDSTELAGSLARWLLGQREHGRWPTTQDNISAISALVSYLKAFENGDAPVTASVSVGRRRIGGASLTRQAPVAPAIRLTGNDLNELIGGAIPGADLSISAGAGRVLYTARLTYEPPDVEEARGVRIARRYSLERDGGPATTFKVGDVVRVTLTLDLHQEGQFLAVTDPLPAGFEPINESFGTTSSWEARQRLRNGDSTFDHSEQHVDRVLVFARRLGAKPEFTYLVRATTAGTFTAAGASVEAMYAPEIFGRTTSTTIQIKR